MGPRQEPALNPFGIVQRYVAKRVLLTVCSVFLLCLVIIFMIDLVEILRIAGKSGTIPMASVVWIVLLRLPSFAELTMPFAILSGTIGAFLMLNRSAEITVTRAAGMSVWQFLMPGLAVAIGLGVFANTTYNPMAAAARAKSEEVYAKAFGEKSSLFSGGSAGQWLRQDGVDGSSVVSATSTANQGRSLSGVQVVQFDRRGAFVEHVEAQHAELRDGYWELTNAVVERPKTSAERFDSYQVSTYLTPTEVNETLGSELSVSFWQLPSFIELAERAGLPARAFRVQYASLLSRPIQFAIMVLLAGTVALRSFRFGKIQTKVVGGLVFGFGFFVLAEVSRQMGVAGLISSVASVLVPVAIGGFASVTVLLHQEDG
jgi:lipopolysaccharide export system permease protein